MNNSAHLVIRGRHREKLRLFDSLLNRIFFFISSRDLLLVWGMFKPLHYGASALGEYKDTNIQEMLQKLQREI